jgi:hypothetical protein
MKIFLTVKKGNKCTKKMRNKTYHFKSVDMAGSECLLDWLCRD